MLHKCERKGCKKKFATTGKRHPRRKYCSKRCAGLVYYKSGATPAYQREWKSRPGCYEKMMFWSAKSRAKKKDLPFNLELQDIIVPKVCPVLPWIELTPVANKETRFTTSPALDRVIPELGYTKGNVRVISGRANVLKNNATIEELEAVLNDLKSTQGGKPQ